MVCVEDCPSEALLETVHGVFVVDDNCLDCGMCVDECGNSAISMT
jgi:Fe-S-cluster-containing hydrogenase component 2